MNAETNPDSPSSNSNFNSFPKPRLFPEGWDLSEADLKTQPPSVSEQMPDQETDLFEPFHEPRTIPGGWHLA
jgi:hypothetical protein